MISFVHYNMILECFDDFIIYSRGYFSYVTRSLTNDSLFNLVFSFFT